MIKPFKPFPVFETDRLILRALVSSDEADIFAMRSHPFMHQYTDTIPDVELKQSSDYIERVQKGIDESQFILWAIAIKSLNKVIGTVCIWNLDDLLNCGELGYGLHPNYHHQGYMKEALSGVIKFGLETMKLSKIEAFTEINNLDSIHLLDKLKFKREKVIVEKGHNVPRDYHMAVYYVTP